MNWKSAKVNFLESGEKWVHKYTNTNCLFKRGREACWAQCLIKSKEWVTVTFNFTKLWNRMTRPWRVSDLLTSSTFFIKNNVKYTLNITLLVRLPIPQFSTVFTVNVQTQDKTCESYMHVASALKQFFSPAWWLNNGYPIFVFRWSTVLIGSRKDFSVWNCSIF